MTKILNLHLKSKWWYKIESGEKNIEFRLNTEFWRKRLIGKNYDEIHFWLGYPKKTDTKKLLIKYFLGVSEKSIIHEEFGDKPVSVFCINFK